MVSRRGPLAQLASQKSSEVEKPDTPLPGQAMPVLGEQFHSRTRRVYKAAELRLAGADWETVADSMGYKNPQQAMRAVTNYLHTRWTRARDETGVIDIELDRLDRLQAVHWEAAMHGDLPSGKFILEIIKFRSTITGIQKRPAETVTNNSIFIGGDESQYVNALTNLRRATAIEAAPDAEDNEVIEMEEDG